MVDYLGTILTLVGCTLVILPLIWVSFLRGVGSSLVHHLCDSGRGDFPLELCRCACTLDFGVLCDWIVLCMGMEGSEATYRTK